MMKPRLALAGGGFHFSGTEDNGERYTLLGLGRTGCSALTVLDAEGESGYCAISIDKDIFSTRTVGLLKTTSRPTQNEKFSDYLSRELTDSWATLVLADLNDEIDPEMLGTVASCCHQKSELSVAIVIEREGEAISSDCHLGIFQQFDTCISLSPESIWDIGKKTKRLRLCGVKEFSLTHLARCYLNVLWGNGVYAIDHIDLKNLFHGKLITVGVGVARGEGRILKALQQAISSLKCNSSKKSALFACLTMSGSTYFDELAEVETALESLEVPAWLADVHLRVELNADLLDLGRQ